MYIQSITFSGQREILTLNSKLSIIRVLAYNKIKLLENFSMNPPMELYSSRT